MGERIINVDYRIPCAAVQIENVSSCRTDECFHRKSHVKDRSAMTKLLVIKEFQAAIAVAADFVPHLAINHRRHKQIAVSFS